MITELRWVRGGYGKLVLEACDGHQWFPVPFVNPPFTNEVPCFDNDGVVSSEKHHEIMGYAAQPDKGAKPE